MVFGFGVCLFSADCVAGLLAAGGGVVWFSCGGFLWGGFGWFCVANFICYRVLELCCDGFRVFVVAIGCCLLVACVV